MDGNVFSGNILDPFLGSGTLGVCCEKLNKAGHNIKWTGIELEKNGVTLQGSVYQKYNKLW